MKFSLGSNTATCYRKYSVACSMNKPDWRTWMTINCTDSIALLDLDREKWICKFCWCWYHVYETMKVDSFISWAKKRLIWVQAPNLKRRKLCVNGPGHNTWWLWVTRCSKKLSYSQQTYCCQRSTNWKEILWDPANSGEITFCCLCQKKSIP